jgi:hypothetical protein
MENQGVLPEIGFCDFLSKYIITFGNQKYAWKAPKMRQRLLKTFHIY